MMSLFNYGITRVRRVKPISEYVLHFDGGSRGNPGEAGAGYTITRDGKEICYGWVYIGRGTNNKAEYSGLLYGLKAAVSRNMRVLTVKGDSKLVINQVQRIWKVRQQDLAVLRDQCCALTSDMTVVYEHVPRAQNKRADELANKAMDTSSSEHFDVLPWKAIESKSS